MTAPIPGLGLRLASADDQPFLRALHAAVHGPQFDAIDDPHLRQQIVDMQFTAQHAGYAQQFPDSVHHVILLDGTPVGRLWVNRQPDEIRVLDISVHPHHQSRGIGRALLQDLQGDARATDVALRHSVLMTNVDAQRLYERLGFTVVGETSGSHLAMEWHPNH